VQAGTVEPSVQLSHCPQACEAFSTPIKTRRSRSWSGTAEPRTHSLRPPTGSPKKTLSTTPFQSGQSGECLPQMLVQAGTVEPSVQLSHCPQACEAFSTPIKTRRSRSWSGTAESSTHSLRPPTGSPKKTLSTTPFQPGQPGQCLPQMLVQAGTAQPSVQLPPRPQASEAFSTPTKTLRSRSWGGAEELRTHPLRPPTGSPKKTLRTTPLESGQPGEYLPWTCRLPSGEAVAHGVVSSEAELDPPSIAEEVLSSRLAPTDVWCQVSLTSDPCTPPSKLELTAVLSRMPAPEAPTRGYEDVFEKGEWKKEARAFSEPPHRCLPARTEPIAGEYKTPAINWSSAL